MGFLKRNFGYVLAILALGTLIILSLNGGQGFDLLRKLTSSQAINEVGEEKSDEIILRFANKAGTKELQEEGLYTDGIDSQDGIIVVSSKSDDGTETYWAVNEGRVEWKLVLKSSKLIAGSLTVNYSMVGSVSPKYSKWIIEIMGDNRIAASVPLNTFKSVQDSVLIPLPSVDKSTNPAHIRFSLQKNLF